MSKLYSRDAILLRRRRWWKAPLIGVACGALIILAFATEVGPIRLDPFIWWFGVLATVLITLFAFAHMTETARQLEEGPSADFGGDL